MRKFHLNSIWRQDMNSIFEEAQEKNFFDKVYSCENYKPFPNATDRAFWEKLNPVLKDSLIREAKKYVNFEWPGIRATEILAYARFGERRAEEKINEKRRALLALTLAECVVYDNSFIDDITDGLWSICEESCWAAAAHIDTCGGTFDGLPRTEEKILDLNACETAQLVSFVYYMLHDKLKAQSIVLTERVKGEVNRRIVSPYLTEDCYWWIGKTGRKLNNWNPWCNSNVLFSALCTEENYNLRCAIIKKVMESIDLFLYQYPSDGACDEGTSYWFKAGGKLINALEILSGASENKLDIKHIDKAENIGMYIVNARLCGNYYQNFADGSAIINEPDAFAIYNMGRVFNNEIFINEGRFLRKYMKNIASFKNFAAWEVMRRIKYYDEIKEKAATNQLRKSIYFEGTQNMISRQSTEAEKGLILAVKGGTNIESHNHNDIGNFIVYNDGRPVIIDVGVGTYSRDTFNENRYTIWTMQSLYHNLPIVNGKGEHEGEKYIAENVSHSFADEKDIFSLNLKKAYETDCGIENWIRTAELDRKEKTITVEDDFRLNRQSELEFTLMLANKPTINENMVKAGNCKIAIVSDCKMEVFCEEIMITDSKLYNEWGDSIYRIHIKFAEKVKSGKIKVKINRDF